MSDEQKPLGQIFKDCDKLVEDFNQSTQRPAREFDHIVQVSPLICEKVRVIEMSAYRELEKQLEALKKEDNRNQARIHRQSQIMADKDKEIEKLKKENESYFRKQDKLVQEIDQLKLDKTFLKKENEYNKNLSTREIMVLKRENADLKAKVASCERNLETFNSTCRDWVKDYSMLKSHADKLRDVLERQRDSDRYRCSERDEAIEAYDKFIKDGV